MNPNNDLQKTNVLTNCSNDQEEMLNNLLTHNTAVIDENQVPNICTEKKKISPQQGVEKIASNCHCEPNTLNGKRTYYCITDDSQRPELDKDDVDCEPHTPKTKRIGLSADHDHHYIRTPRTMEKIIAQLQDERMKFDAVIKSQNRVINSLGEKLTSMSQLIKELEEKHMVSRSTANCLETISDQSVLEFIQRAAGNGDHVSKKQYAPSLRSFALTLHYYSPKAYNFVRNKFNKALPSPGILRSWYNSIDGNPGFTEESFIALKRKVEEAREHEKKEVLVA